MSRFKSEGEPTDATYSYTDVQLRRIEYIVADDKIRIVRDSIVYNDLGQLQTIFRFSNKEQETTPFRLHEFTYNQSGQVVNVLLFDKDKDLIQTEVYQWENGNIVRESSFDAVGELTWEVNYTFDQQINPYQHLPNSLFSTLFYNTNNIVYHEVATSYDVVFSCNPCLTQYEYDRDGYPKTITYQNGLKKKLKYD